MKKVKVSAIVPVYNEGESLFQVVDLLTKSSWLDEVIIVDDGSTNKTTQIVKQKFPQVRLVSHVENKGKGDALLTGVKEAKYPVVLFCDADLIGLQEKHLRQLILPVVEGKVRMVVGAQEYMLPLKRHRWYQKLFGWWEKRRRRRMSEFVMGLGGEKVLWKEDFLQIPGLQGSHYGVEQMIIDYFQEQGLSFEYALLLGVGHIHKVGKWGWEGLKKDVVSYVTFGRQYWKRLRMRKG